MDYNNSYLGNNLNAWSKNYVLTYRSETVQTTA